MNRADQQLVLEQVEAYGDALTHEIRATESLLYQAVRRGEYRNEHELRGQLRGLQRAAWILRATVLDPDNEVLFPPKRGAGGASSHPSTHGTIGRKDNGTSS